MKKYQRGFVGITIIIIVALGILGFGAYKVFHKATPAEESVNISEGNFPSDYKPADHSDTSSVEVPSTISSTSDKQNIQAKTSVSTETSNWQLYSNTQYGFQIQYPKNTEIADVNVGDNVMFRPDPSLRLLQILIQKQLGCYENAPGAHPETVDINGVKFVRFDVSDYTNTYSRYSSYKYCFIKDGTAYNLIPRIKYKRGEEVDVNKDSVLNQMISSFKFTK